ncbi:MAG: hypothetical protein M1837_005139 [Sclerophora amabilis]|nr:MAG: hypothetical protein M1837_005139 [Sclerophora amabilis]
MNGYEASQRSSDRPAAQPPPSTSSSSFQVPSNNPTAAAAAAASNSSHLFASPPPQFAQAPLSSPSGNQAAPYFSSGPPVTSHQSQQSQSQPQPQSQPPPRHPSSSQSTYQMHGEHPTNSERGRANDPSATAPFIRDLNLVSEAAKRAQMACLMRDLDGVAL